MDSLPTRRFWLYTCLALHDDMHAAAFIPKKRGVGLDHFRYVWLHACDVLCKATDKTKKIFHLKVQLTTIIIISFSRSNDGTADI